MVLAIGLVGDLLDDDGNTFDLVRFAAECRSRDRCLLGTSARFCQHGDRTRQGLLSDFALRMRLCRRRLCACGLLLHFPRRLPDADGNPSNRAWSRPPSKNATTRILAANTSNRGMGSFISAQPI